MATVRDRHNFSSRQLSPDVNFTRLLGTLPDEALCFWMMNFEKAHTSDVVMSNIM
jgi:hypothetical protein